MSKNLINEGDTVVFAQRYLADDIFSTLYGKQGKVLSVKEEYAVINFNDAAVEVYLEDLEKLNTSSTPELENEEIEIDRVDLLENHDCSGLQPAQLIAHKLLAQETDTGLNNEITQLLNINQ